MNNIIPIRNAEAVEVKITSTSQTRFQFPISENLRGKKVVGVETYKVADVSVSPLGNALCNATALAKGSLTLQVEGKERIKDIPLASLIASNNNGLIKTIKPAIVSLEKSYVTFANTTGLVANETVLFMFYFED